MAVWSEINLSAIELTRIDAEFYKPEFLAAKEAGGNSKFKTYKVSVMHPAEFTRRYAEDGLLVLLAQNNRDNSYDWSSKHFASNDLRGTISRNRLEFGDVTITRSGANFGQTSVIGIELDEQEIYACADLLVLRSPLIDGYLVSTYLNSSIGKRLLNRGAYGGAQPHIAPTYIREIPFPEHLVASEKEVSKLVKQSRILGKQAERLYTQAQQLLESELGLDKLVFQKPIGYTAQFSDMEQSRRIDPEHYFPEFKAFVKALPADISLEPLSRHLRFCQRGTQPIYIKSGLPVINSKHVQPNRVLLEDNRFAMPNPVPDFQIRYGDILMNGTGRGTLGRVAPYLREGLAVPDNHVTILRSDTLDPAYVSFYLNSTVGQMQVEMHQRGSSGQLELYPFDIRKFLIWPPSEPLQKELRELYEKAIMSEQESKRLLQQAKTRVEKLIEEAAKP